MDLPLVSSLSHTEATARVQLDEEDTCDYSSIYDSPFGANLELARSIPPTVKDAPPPGMQWKNWCHWLAGYDDWAVPELAQPDLAAYSMRQMRTQFMYKKLVKPSEVQMKMMFAAPIERELKSFSESERFKELATKVYVLKIELSPLCTSAKKNIVERTEGKVVVWRLVTAFGDTNLDSFHGMVIAPAMGWRRHYHAYKFIQPTSGANFGPNKSDAIDMCHAKCPEVSYFLEAEEYDIRHVLRKKGDRLGYVYDLGDSWTHIITLLDVVDKSTVLKKAMLSDPQILKVWDEQVGDSSPPVVGSRLLAGEINCPPEDSMGCSGMRNYGSILSRPSSFVPAEFGVNWQEHRIRRAYDFNLKAHQKRFEKAITHRRNPADGTLKYGGALAPDLQNAVPAAQFFAGLGVGAMSSGFFGETPGRKVKTDHASGCGASEVLGKHNPLRHCDFCKKQAGSNSSVKVSQCSRCQKVAYCGRDCQSKAWPSHKKECARTEAGPANL